MSNGFKSIFHFHRWRKVSKGKYVCRATWCNATGTK